MAVTLGARDSAVINSGKAKMSSPNQPASVVHTLEILQKKSNK